MFPMAAHKDVLFKHPPGKRTLRTDKIRSHAANFAHDRAVQKWRAARAVAIEQARSTTAVIPHSPACRADLALANLVRTIMTTAVNKCSISLVSSLIQLQVTNQTLISTHHSDRTTGVQSFLHAGMLYLQGQQNTQLRAAGMLSDMGDGSTDRKNISSRRSSTSSTRRAAVISPRASMGCASAVSTSISSRLT